MKLFFPYFGSKRSLSERHLGPPRRDHVVEPFCGAAAYSTSWEPKQVTLIDKDPRIVGVWHYLQRVSPEELLRLPSNISSLDQLPASTCQEARDLIGFWFDRGRAAPSPNRSNWARQARYQGHFWSKTRKLCLARQVEKIRHWTIAEGDYSQAPDIDAHWHIDAPYKTKGKSYRVHEIDYHALADWCLGRKGFVHVCEHVGADWLPFEPLAEIVTHRYRIGRVSHEALFEMETRRARP
jgi:hypothetical protein